LQKYKTFVKVIFFIKSRIRTWLPREKFSGHKKERKKKEEEKRKEKKIEKTAAKGVKFGIQMG
jgi:hypothetical protein